MVGSQLPPPYTITTEATAPHGLVLQLSCTADKITVDGDEKKLTSAVITVGYSINPRGGPVANPVFTTAGTVPHRMSGYTYEVTAKSGSDILAGPETVSCEASDCAAAMTSAKIKEVLKGASWDDTGINGMSASEQAAQAEWHLLYDVNSPAHSEADRFPFRTGDDADDDNDGVSDNDGTGARLRLHPNTESMPNRDGDPNCCAEWGTGGSPIGVGSSGCSVRCKRNSNPYSFWRPMWGSSPPCGHLS